MYAIHSVKVFHYHSVLLFLPQEEIKANIKINFLILAAEEKDKQIFMPRKENEDLGFGPDESAFMCFLITALYD